MTDKAWSAECEEELRNTQLRLQELKRQKDMSTARIHDKIGKYIDKTVASHELGLRGINDFLVVNRWELVNILTEGEYAKLLQFRALSLEQAAND